MRRVLALSIAASLLVVATAVPAAAKNDNYHFIQHAAAADFNHTEANLFVVGIHASWYSPQSDFGGGVGPADPRVNITYWGTRIGDDCEFSQTFYDFEYRWSMNHAYVGVDTPCGYLELIVNGERGANPDDFTPKTTYNEVTDVSLLLDGQPIPVVFTGGSIWRSSVTVKRPS